jgi:phage gp45-like
VPAAPTVAGAAEAVVLFVGGLRDHPLVVSVDDRRYRKTGLAAGEVALYNHQSVYLLLKTGQVIEANAPIDLVNSAVYRVAGTQVVGAQGAAVADSTATAASVSTQLNLLLSRLRAHGLIAS